MTDSAASQLTAPSSAEPTVDGNRLWARLMAMAEIGRRGETGVDRPAFSSEDRAARRLLYEWACECGLEVSQDAIGNLFLRYPGRRRDLAPVLTGSHLDSQPTGGRFDGAYGVLASLEAVATLSGAGIRPQRSIEVVAWSNEEGGRFAPGAMGSQIFAGLRSLSDLLPLRDASGATLRESLSDTLAALPEAAIRSSSAPPAAYLEAHIEQGPRLYREEIPVGVVSGIQGCLWLEYEVRGVAAHAGTTPHEYRRDALEGAVRLIGQLRSRCLERSADCRFTVGRLNVEPNTPNTIPGCVTFTIDFRDADPAAFDELGRELREAAAPESFGLDIRELFRHSPEMFPREIVGVVAAAAQTHHYRVLELVSGAFHDALFIANICPAGMIFIRCRDGVSHNPLEFADPADVTAGAQVLTSALLELSRS
ncbi:MAG TPA: M20 family metallo-hydrolase [Steroidobacteraceae bacterium]|jgi:N-carbamoyl-L-amino-acid hydrolase|nr:M20 family metallo-hydrolase [Steroidobacteraceae bacterium]